MDIPLIVKPIGEVHLEMVKNPHYGYGKNLNPCIDCHAMMFRIAGEIMAKQGFDFLFSGEVLGQRPMSQNLSALQAVAKHSGMTGRILRPMSARLLPETPMEKEGLVDRSRLLDIQGRTRRRQAEFAEAWGLTDYPPSGGGCLLTEKSFSGRLRDLFLHQPEATVTDVELLKLGRQFRLSPNARLTLGRDQGSNEKIKGIARPTDILLRSASFTGPLGLVSGRPEATDLELAAAVVAAYGKGQDEPQVEILLLQGNVQRLQAVAPRPREACQDLRID
jgi:hypothetical protein